MQKMIEQIVSDLKSSDIVLCNEAAVVIEYFDHLAKEYEQKIYFQALMIRALEDDLGLPHL
jgi:hypothetical protein